MASTRRTAGCGTGLLATVEAMSSRNILPSGAIVPQNGAMRQRALQAVLLVHAIEQSDLAGDALSATDRAYATQEALEGRPFPNVSPTGLDVHAERFLVRRAHALLARLRVRSPGVDRILAAAAGPTGLDRLLLVLAFLIGVAIAFADGSRIDIFAYPLAALVLWNLIVYLILALRFFRPSGPRAARGSTTVLTASEIPSMRQDGFIRRWLARFYGNRIRGRIDGLIAHSIGFNAPLAPGLRRFAADWWEAGRPLFRLRVRRLLHLGAILVAAGLMAGYDIRGWILREAAGWGSTFFGPGSAHTALVGLYGAGSAVSGVAVPSAQQIQALAWIGPTTGGGPAGIWLYLIAWTALLYIVAPRVILAIVSTISLWRASGRLQTPPAMVAYLTAMAPPPPPAPPEAPHPSSG